jgi:hypothetical protein
MFYVKIVFFIDQQERNAIFIEKMFSSQIMMTGVIKVSGCTKTIMM